MQRPLIPIYILAFLLALYTALPAYVNSTFIEGIVGERFVGLLFTISSIMTIISFVVLPKILARFGNYRVITGFVFLQIFFGFALAFLKLPILIIAAFLVYLALGPLVWFSMDLFLEHYSNDSETGSLRGIYLTILNIGWLVAPLTAGVLLGETNRFWLLYTVAALAIVPVIPILARYFKKYADPTYRHLPFWKTLKAIMKRPALSRIFTLSFLLQFFYAWMVIYTPIYLNQHIGLGWDEIGIIFTIMLLPFVFFEYPVGWIADRWIGEKEMLIGSFIITGLTTIALAFVATQALWVWAVLLFGTRVGASAISVLSDSYFFKHTTDADSDILGFFRMTSPIAFSIAPLAATALLVALPLSYLFSVLGFLCLIGALVSLQLHDTR